MIRIIVTILLLFLVIIVKLQFATRSMFDEYERLDDVALTTIPCFYKDKTLILCGMVRDSSASLASIKDNIEKLRTIFAKVHILIVENDSKDDTRTKLLEWTKTDNHLEVLGCNGVNLEKCCLGLSKTLNGRLLTDLTSRRMDKMVRLRNVYLNHIRSSPELLNFDFTMVLDMDLIGNLYTKGIEHTGLLFERYDKLDAVAANGWLAFPFCRSIYYYYDTYAFRPEGWCKYVFPPAFHNVTNHFKTKPFAVQSAFAGACIYKTSSIKKLSYKLKYQWGLPVCEHVTLHENLQMCIDPRFVYRIDRNP